MSEAITIKKGINTILDKLSKIDTKIDNFQGFFEFNEKELKTIEKNEKLGLCDKKQKKEVEEILSS